MQSDIIDINVRTDCTYTWTNFITYERDLEIALSKYEM